MQDPRPLELRFSLGSMLCEVDSAPIARLSTDVGPLTRRALPQIACPNPCTVEEKFFFCVFSKKNSAGKEFAGRAPASSLSRSSVVRGRPCKFFACSRRLHGVFQGPPRNCGLRCTIRRDEQAIQVRYYLGGALPQRRVSTLAPARITRTRQPSPRRRRSSTQRFRLRTARKAPRACPTSTV